MITLLEVLNYRCLRYVRQELNSFHVLIGPNASGKSTFLDAIRFIGSILSEGLERALYERSPDPQSLMWRGEATRFEIAIEAEIPDSLLEKLVSKKFTHCRYEVAVGYRNGKNSDEIGLLQEKFFLFERKTADIADPKMISNDDSAETIITSSRRANSYLGLHYVASKVPDAYDCFDPECGESPNLTLFKLGYQKSALANVPEDESQFPVTSWFKRCLKDNIASLVLNSELMRRPSPPGKPGTFRTDGANLPWVILEMQETAPDQISKWIAHVRTALPDLRNIKVIERPEDRHCYLMVEYEGGLKVPSWLVSDGTLRLFALTLLPYLHNFDATVLIEEPENGIHPKAIETVYQSLSSVREHQVLLATHSPTILSVAKPKDVLCFSKSDEGETLVVTGDQHPALKDWYGEVNLSVLYAGGVLG